MSQSPNRSAGEWLACIVCSKTYAATEVRYACDCGALLSVERDPVAFAQITPGLLRDRALSHDDLDISGVWRYREVILTLDPQDIVTHPEGRTHLYQRESLAAWSGVHRLRFKHEGENPTGSFKDRGMTVAVSRAKSLGLNAVACASTGNTSAALAAYAAQAGMQAVVFVPEGKITLGKLAQALGYGATVLQIKGDFDAAMHLVQETARHLGLYLVNSVNPFRLEGQKSIIFELLEQLSFKVPEWLVVPAGNLGNTSAFGKAFREALQAGWIDRMPRIVSVQATGANPFAQSFRQGLHHLQKMTAKTVASAIQIGDPVNWAKARRVIQETQGFVTDVTDLEILEAKEAIDKSGLGCEPASAATLAGVRQLTRQGIIQAQDHVVCILTGHMLKDPDVILSHAGQKAIRVIDPDLKAVEMALKEA